MMNFISSMHLRVYEAENLNKLDSQYSNNFIPEYVNSKKKLISDINSNL